MKVEWVLWLDIEEEDAVTLIILEVWFTLIVVSDSCRLIASEFFYSSNLVIWLFRLLINVCIASNLLIIKSNFFSNWLLIFVEVLLGLYLE